MHPPCLVRRPRAPAPDRHGQGRQAPTRARIAPSPVPIPDSVSEEHPGSPFHLARAYTRTRAPDRPQRPIRSTSRAGIRALAGSQVSPSGSGAPFPCTRSTTRSFGSSGQPYPRRKRIRSAVPLHPVHYPHPLRIVQGSPIRSTSKAGIRTRPRVHICGFTYALLPRQFMTPDQLY